MVSFDPGISSLSVCQWHWISAPEGVCGSCNGSFCLCFHLGGESLTNSMSVSLVPPLLGCAPRQVSARSFGGWIMVVAAWVILVPHWLAERERG